LVPFAREFTLPATVVVKTSLAKHDVVDISHPGYSPDLAPADFFLTFPTVETALKRKRVQCIENMKRKVTAELNAVSLKAFANCFKASLNDSTLSSSGRKLLLI
jgi:hypothetical protein